MKVLVAGGASGSLGDAVTVTALSELLTASLLMALHQHPPHLPGQKDVP